MRPRRHTCWASLRCVPLLAACAVSVPPEDAPPADAATAPPPVTDGPPVAPPPPADEVIPLPPRLDAGPQTPPPPDEGAPPPPDAGAAPEPPDLDGGLPPPEEEPPSEPPSEPDDPCQGLDYLGECQGTVARWCEDGALQQEDCAWVGQGCGWVDNEIGYYCGGSGDGPGGGAPPDGPPPPPPAGGECGTATESRVVALVNAARAQAGLGALACDPAGVRAAQAHSQDQCDMGFMSHTGSDGSDAGTRLRRAGAQFGGWGENVAWGSTTPEDVHDMWMHSPGHYANIMGGFSRMGAGHAPCGGQHYWTEVFLD